MSADVRCLMWQVVTRGSGRACGPDWSSLCGVTKTPALRESAPPASAVIPLRWDAQSGRTSSLDKDRAYPANGPGLVGSYVVVEHVDEARDWLGQLLFEWNGQVRRTFIVSL